MQSDMYYYQNDGKSKRKQTPKNGPNRTANHRRDHRSPTRSLSPVRNPSPVRIPSPIPTQTLGTQTATPEMTENEIINQIYSNPKFPSSYSSNLKKFIRQKESLSLHKQRRKRFRRRQVYVGGPWSEIQADTIHFREYGRRNNGFKYILVVVDAFSRKNWVRAQKTVTAKETAKNLDDIIASMKYFPRTFSSDKGSEFLISNKDVYDILIDKYGMVIFTLKPPLKASMCERTIRTLKTRIQRYFTEHDTLKWVDVIQQFSKNLNNTINRTIGIEPNKVNFDNRKQIYNRLYGSNAAPPKCRFSIGDIVRIPEKKNIFEKGYSQNWTKALYTIIKTNNDGKVCYYDLVDSEGTKLDKKFYEPELNLVIRYVHSS